MTTTMDRTDTRPAREPHTTAQGSGVRDQRFRTLQLVLFTAGAVMMPLGILVICLGWYGSAHSHYQYDQNTYLVSGGILGLGLTFFGGFLYFGAWLARLSSEQRDSTRQLTDAIVALVGHGSGDAMGGSLGASEGAAPVLAGAGSTVHRRDCSLIAQREDLKLYRGDGTAVISCRVCRPEI